ncbi:MAG TPA: RIP metalloprotease RseP [Gemmatimonadaceae bacterium]|nr:RIP metalloprotease RseP [Gemmatimonadaceae bacterium]
MLMFVLRVAAAIVFVFGTVIFVHELGHFLAAKLFGVYAPRFSIGFGPALWKRRRGETEYVIAALPLGGYVRMASREDETMALIEGGGERPRQEAGAVGGSGAAVVPIDADSDDVDPEAMAPFGPKPIPEHRYLESKSTAARLIILLAGVTMNLLYGFVITTGLFVWKGEPVIRTRVVGAVDSTAAIAGLTEKIHPGDTIFAVDGHTVSTWNDVRNRIATASGPQVALRTSSGTATLPAGSEDDRSALSSAIAPYIAPVISGVDRGSPAARAGMRPGDSIVALNGAPVDGWSDVVRRVQSAPGVPVSIRVIRDDAPVELTVRPESARVGRGEQRRVIGKIGAGADLGDDYEPVSFGQAVSLGWHGTWRLAGIIVGAVRDMVSGQGSLRDLGGPVAIADATATAVRTGLDTVLFFTALLSVNLAIFNMLPIPILDGGQVLITLIEGIRGSALSPRTREMVMRVGLVLIILLFVFVTVNDLSRLGGAIRDFFGRLFGI